MKRTDGCVQNKEVTVSHFQGTTPPQSPQKRYFENLNKRCGTLSLKQDMAKGNIYSNENDKLVKIDKKERNI